MENINLIDLVAALWRQKKLFLVASGVVFVLALLFVFQWSNYRSIATVEIALPEISSQSLDNGQETSPEQIADLRISYLQQKVLSTGSLVEIITKFNLYPDLRRTRPVADVAEKMLSKINLDLISSSTSSAAKNTAKTTTIAFTLSFDYAQPLLAQQVANELVTRFLDEDLKQRQNQAKETTTFLAAQLEVLKKSLAEQENKIAEFRAKYGETRPESLAFNQSAMTSLTMNMQNLDSQIASNLGSLGSLQAQLASLDPYTRVVGDNQVLTTPTVQYRAAKSEYASLSAKYGPDHPDVIKARRQMESLSQYQDSNTNVAAVQALLDDVRTKLKEAGQTKGADNPEVVSLKKQEKELQAQLKREKSKPAAAASHRDADNPAYLAVLAQIQSTELRAKALDAQKVALQAQIDKYQKAVVENPEAEKQMAALSRDYANAQERYRILQAKKLEAEMSETIENNRVGQRLQIVNPPELPISTQPSRMILLLAGIVLSAGFGGAVVLGRVLMAQSVIGAQHLEALTGVAPLVVVPHIVTKAERVTVNQRHIKMVVWGLAGLVVAAVIFSYQVMPLDVLMSVLAMKLGLN